MNLKIHIENFKSITSTDIELKEGLNILIGPNGAGKTCLLSSMKFLRDTMMQGAGLAMAKGGGPKRNYHRGKRYIYFDVEFEYGERLYRHKRVKTFCNWQIRIEQKGPEKIATITNEQLLISIKEKEQEDIVLFHAIVDRSNIDRPLLNIYVNQQGAGRNLFRIYDENNRGTKKERLFIDYELRFKKTMTELKKNGDRSFFLVLVMDDYKFMELYHLFNSLTEYNIIPERARQATEQVPYAKMSSNGYGISEVIYALEKRTFHKINRGDDYDWEIDSHYQRFYYNRRHLYREFGSHSRGDLIQALDNINKELSAAVKPIHSVSVQIDPSTGRRFVVFNSTGSQQFYPDEVSDGTIKWLCILTTIYISFSNVYLLEEPENFLHPWMQQKLVQIMREQATKNKTIFLLTSHSTTILNASYCNEVIIVKPTKNGTVANRIDNQNEINEFLNSSDFGLGDLWVSGGIGAIPE